MEDAAEIARTLERLRRAIDKTHAAEAQAVKRTESADARLLDADAHIADADAQTAHADSHMSAAKAHMDAAKAHMADADHRAERADQLQAEAADSIEEADRQSTQAEGDSAEYRRALSHYNDLVRHRVANPLTVVKGMAATLLSDNTIDADTRREMLEAIEQQAEVMERLTLFFR